ncbi:ATP-grasp domain-containing protein [Pseudochryseolinea flava]|uniref:ATP-grasp domain-containing protein n=1 Tax=Pseudochryseolinea flava TaxID=2059302 RepID=A0A364Y7Y6_9BACT|nr:hypothetical protein [Pseudochryseolinea flava]RAW03060.1 hypothetical protein DQQ10_02885 [Pseudochryseolinea flava]
MTFWEKIYRSNFFIKLRHWEYWPFGIVQFPVILYYIWLSLRARSFIFFSGSNPGITMGGMFGESKFDVIKKIPKQYIPQTFLIVGPTNAEEVAQQIKNNGLSLPLIFKPELGERGFMVKRITSHQDIENYIQKMKFNFLIQDLVSYPLEFGVFYTRFPDQEKGRVTSVTMKEMLSVTGDGKTTLQDLILNLDRAKLQWDKLKLTFADRLKEVLHEGEKLELVSIGNHCLGTKFLDGSHLINDELSDAFDVISKQIEGFYFGRFDLRVASLEDLYKGNVKILELNGCGAEPAHIYQPGFPLLKGMKVLMSHWKNIFLIAQKNAQRGFRFTTVGEARQHYKKFKQRTAA